MCRESWLVIKDSLNPPAHFSRLGTQSPAVILNVCLVSVFCLFWIVGYSLPCGAWDLAVYQQTKCAHGCGLRLHTVKDSLFLLYLSCINLSSKDVSMHHSLAHSISV